MQSQVGFILKLIILSAILSALIKYAGPLLHITSTLFVVTMMVFLPTALVALALWWRGWQHQQN